MKTHLRVKRNESRLKIIAAAIIAAIVIIGTIGQTRLASATKEAKQLAKDAGITYDYEINIDAANGDNKAFLEELCHLATWQLEQERLIDKTFDYDAIKAEKERSQTQPKGFEPRRELLEYARKQEWKKERAATRDKAKACIGQLFGDKDHVGWVEKRDVISGVWNGGLHQLSCHQNDFENENAENIYDYLAVNLNWEWAPLPMDVAYELFPEKMLAACEKDLEKAMRSRDLNELKREVSAAYDFANRYGAAPENYIEARNLRDKLQKEKDERAAAQKAGKTDSGKKKKETKHSYSYEPEIDPDDYDIDAYYADNWDEYDDVEDAAEGFLDDDSEWDDY